MINRNIRIVVFLLLTVVSLSIVGCRYFKSDETEIIVARVNNHTLSQWTIEDVMKKNVVSDSAAFIQNYINTWATSQLLLDGALRNLPAEDQEDFEALVSTYRSDLYTRFYKDALINKQLDSVVSDSEAMKFYENNKVNFLLNEPLVQFKFVQVDEDYKNLTSLTSYFKGTDEKDKYALDSLKFQYKNYFLNDAVWIKQRVVIDQINAINKENANNLLKKTNFLQLRDSLGLYLVAVKSTLERNENAPLEYVRPTINQIIKNKRKLALIQKLEKEIKDDAIKNKQFEIYN